MNVSELKNENGSLSGIMIPATDLSEIKDTVKKGTSFYNYLEKLISDHHRQMSNEPHMANELTIEETHRQSAKRTEELYRYAFEKGVPMHYTDERCTGSDQFISANPDGSEDLVSYDPVSEKQLLIKNLLPPGQGKWSYLLSGIANTNETTILPPRGPEWGR